MAITMSDSLATAVLTQLETKLDFATGGAKLKFYSGTRPTNASTALAGNTLLGTAVCSTTAGVVSGRALTFNTITEDSDADATGTASFVRATDGDDAAVIDLGVGTSGSGADVEINTLSIVQHGAIIVLSGVINA